MATWTVAALGLLGLGGSAGVQFLPPHHAVRATAEVAGALDRSLDRRRGAATTTDALVAATLAETDARLHFGLHHKTSLRFGEREREGNCIEYAQLFARLFSDAARRAGSPARAYAVHSERARVYGMRVPLRGWDDHDWVLVVDGAQRRYLDPTLADLDLSADIAGSVVDGARIELP